MLLSRWKLMAGVLGVSLGGLAAVTGQCPKSDTTKSTRRQAELPPAFEIPAIPTTPSAGNAATKAPALPTLPAPVSTPALPPAPTVELPPPPPATELPSLPPAPVKTPAPAPAPAPSKVTPPPMSNPAVPPSPVIPASGTETKPLLPSSEPATPPATTPPALPANTLPTPPMTTTTPPGIDFPLTKVNPPAADPVIEPKPEPKPELKPVVAAANASKYRILLRVGEGEPTFEVKCGDDLILKVICEKIDIKSPEKGNGLSAVKASGKVRFVGFGAEGTCEELSFLAGTGEVSMAGAVKIQVKDKLGRVESELSTETMKYRIDPSATFSGGKP
ncbi:MAG: hypothetical protein C0467_19585 [Planctomycetaceae bacterium]|nr:hypothetical protein [Planctomycetaceae bacterium]